jgi:hypothetical protein
LRLRVDAPQLRGSHNLQGLHSFEKILPDIGIANASIVRKNNMQVEGVGLMGGQDG